MSRLGGLALGVAALVVLAACGPQYAAVRSAVPLDPVPYAELPAPPGQGIFGELHHLEPVEVVVEDYPDRVAIGSTLRFVVALYNRGNDAVPLTPCPAYYMAYGEDAVAISRKGTLNCAAAPASIPVGGRVRFEMKLHIEPVQYLYPGYPCRIFWRLTSSPHGNWGNTNVIMPE